MKKIISAMLCASMLAATAPCMAQEKDAARLTQAQSIGILDLDAVSDLTVPISREQFCEMAYDAIADRLAATDGSNLFDDTDNAKISALYHAGIIEGKTDTEFAPYDNLTREEAAAVLARIVKYTDMAVPEIAMRYADENMISEWAAEAVHIVGAVGIMIGGDNNLFMPKDTYTIEQAAISIMRLYDKLPQIQKSEPQSFADRLNDCMPDDKNYMVSPLSVKMALAMAANGASGDTKSEMLDTLGIDDLDEFNEKAKNIIEVYNNNDMIQLSCENSLWRNTDRDIIAGGFSDGYKKTIAEYYKGEAADVTNENAVEKINGWVSEKTNEKIPTIIDDPNFEMMLINTVYFKARWNDNFYEGATEADTFTSRDGSESQIDFMHKTGWENYSDVNGVKILKLPYNNRVFSYDENGNFRSDPIGVDVSMYIILSDNVNPEDEIKKADFQHVYTAVSMPKFKIEFSTELNEILRSMGMELAFEPEIADFRNITSSGNYFIDKTIHKTYIDVDEYGTEAAAVTSVGLGATALPPEPIEFKADKPFTFVIYDHTNEEVLFMGEYAYAK
ncbi:MAG: S-layer homology domain-containing protein [Oscillospiraceae bacterium]|nr:S-layer homology domain-containing protein [Oscillospiraceae bacterium]